MVGKHNLNLLNHEGLILFYLSLVKLITLPNSLYCYEMLCTNYTSLLILPMWTHVQIVPLLLTAERNNN